MENTLTTAYRFPRPITLTEIERLRDEYNRVWGAETDRSVVFAGGDDPVALNLCEGEYYSILQYDKKGDFYYWNHDARVGSDEPEESGYYAEDYADHGYHERQNFC